MLFKKPRTKDAETRFILVGNPNVGKSTLFNLLTGKRVHTGNWAGKTVSVSDGFGIHNKKPYLISDLPGIASLSSPTAEEMSASNEIARGHYDCCIIVLDATQLARSLALALRVLEITPRCVVCVNLCDEAEKKGITVDKNALEFILGTKVALISAGRKKGVSSLMDAAFDVASGTFSKKVFTPLYSPAAEEKLDTISPIRRDAVLSVLREGRNDALICEMSERVVSLACKIACTVTVRRPARESVDYKIDRVLCSPRFGIPAMLCLLALVLWITVSAANYPSELLARLFAHGDTLLLHLLTALNAPAPLVSALITAVWRTHSSFVSVMLPPMSVFFPFFTLLEEVGYLPRVAFNLDNAFRRCGSCGKQSLTMCMGLGCTCVGVTGSAIISSRRERLIAILTNTFMPCNGRFGALIAVIGMFLASGSFSSGVILMLTLVFAVLMTFLASKLLSATILRGNGEGFILELPPYRRPRVFKIIVSSLIEKALAVLLRAVSVAAPAGLVIWLLSNLSFHGTSIISHLSSFLDPIGQIMGLDGTILLAFILGFPANEIVLPIALMIYTGGSAMTSLTALSSLKILLTSNGWSITTAISFIIFSTLHWPCASAVLTIHKETKSLFWTIISGLLPTAFGFILCIIVHFAFLLFA